MKNDKKSQALFYTVNKVSEILQTTPKTVRQYINMKQLVAHRLPNNGGYRISESDLHTFIGGLRID